eukprot:GILI01001103.1.p1 GENE.GILI01001103.1~~GILI01001103.1.p1  ORF type:complete len:340 (-),score=88.00 GILI01001103.1:177-1196(-)
MASRHVPENPVPGVALEPIVEKETVSPPPSKVEAEPLTGAAVDKWEKFRIPFVLALNAGSSIGIVTANKVVFEYCHFKYGTLLTFIHFVFTWVGLEVARRCGLFEYKPVDFKKMLPLCIAFCGFVVLTNLSLVYNTVGFYQVMKVLTTPLLVVIQTLFYGETFSTPIKLSLGLTCVGVLITTLTDSQANFFGTMIAASALLITCMYQIWVGTKQKELDCNGYQLLYWQAPISAVMLIPIIPVFDNVFEITEMPPPYTIFAIVFSSCLAFLVNLSIFLVIGKTSPVTYNVLGHFKLTVIMSLGFLFFGAPIELKNLSGIFVTLAGVFWYTHIKTSGGDKK